MFLTVYFISKNSSNLTELLSHYFFTQSPPQMVQVSHCGTNFSILCWSTPVSCVTNQHVTTLSTLQTSLNLWLARFCFCWKQMTSPGNEFPWYNHHPCRIINYKIKCHNLFSDWHANTINHMAHCVKHDFNSFHFSSQHKGLLFIIQFL
jgi:hypothetical protein